MPVALHATLEGDCVCIGVSVTLYANVAGDDVCVLVYLSPRTVLELVTMCLYLCAFHFVR